MNKKKGKLPTAADGFTNAPWLPLAGKCVKKIFNQKQKT